MQALVAPWSALAKVQHQCIWFRQLLSWETCVWSTASTHSMHARVAWARELPKHYELAYEAGP